MAAVSVWLGRYIAAAALTSAACSALTLVSMHLSTILCTLEGEKQRDKQEH